MLLYHRLRIAAAGCASMWLLLMREGMVLMRRAEVRLMRLDIWATHRSHYKISGRNYHAKRAYSLGPVGIGVNI